MKESENNVVGRLLNFKVSKELDDEIRRESFRCKVSSSEMIRACVKMALPFLRENPNMIYILNGKLPNGCIHKKK
ncbi:MAG: hypothetical protein ABIF11_03000 [Nitrospirota bacterium]